MNAASIRPSCRAERSAGDEDARPRAGAGRALVAVAVSRHEHELDVVAGGAQPVGHPGGLGRGQRRAPRCPAGWCSWPLLRVENQWHRSGDQAHVARVEVEELVQCARVTAAAALLGELPDPHSGGVEQLLDDAVDRLGDLVTLGRVEVREAPREPGEFGGDDVPARRRRALTVGRPSRRCAS